MSRNAEVAALLEAIATALELEPGNLFRVRAYQEAARSVGFLGEDIGEMHRQGRLLEIRGVGQSIAAKIAEFLDTGRSSYLERICKGFPPAVLQLTRVPGLGPRRAKLLFEKLGIMTLSDLREAAEAHRICGLRGMGERTEEQIRKELARLTRRSRRHPLCLAWPLADRISAQLRASPGVIAAEAAGSIRRRQEDVGDVDILVASDDPAGVREAVMLLPTARDLLAAGATKISFLTAEDIQVDVRVVPTRSWGAALQYFTGSKAHNIALRERAIKLGYKLSEYGVFDADSGEWAGGLDEAEVYHLLGLDWIPPELRENRGEIEAAEAGSLPRLLAEEDVRGDLHVHSKYSDGEDTLAAMAEAARERGYRYMAITDHSAGLGIAQGLTPEKARRQWEEILALNRRLAPFRILRGVELEIRASGQLDLAPDILAGFEYATASLHLGTRMSAERLTGRMVAALASPWFRGLNHPTGRLLGRRPAYDFDLGAVLAAARAHGKTLEINGAGDRLDLGDRAARQARDLGVKLSLGSDAHSVGGLDGMRLAVAIARRAWCRAEDVINTRDVADLVAASSDILGP
ncbi:MAG: DNA polymerase/3'-5' exonuclease PolX [Candidatus Sericytochromatia bacterium]|nr:DNA polymerase/3'-5' exonuclease PolX [Candidatus Tanganyikabacteria bacterium]